MVNKVYKYHYIYKTTNLINGKYYIGMHSTDNLEDGYLGSGKIIKASIKKYGKENFKFEILEQLNDRKTLKEREKEIVNKEEVNNKLCMNLQLGGGGGFKDEEHQKKCSLAGAKAIGRTDKSHATFKFKMETDPTYSQQVRDKRRINKKNNFACTFKGRVHKEESKLKMSNSHKGAGLKEKNSQFGTMWITNGIINKKIKKEETIPLDFYKGRT